MSTNGKPADVNKPAKCSDTTSANKAPEKSQSCKEESPSKIKVTVAPNMEPTYYIGGGNGVSLIDEVLSDLGWRRTRDKCDENFKLRWCELKSAINYRNFREGEQLVNHIPNCQLLTNKMGLLNSLQEYDRVCSNMKRRPIRLDFIPETYKLGEARHRTAFAQTFKEGDIWICKPTGRNQGKGIFLVRNLQEIQQMLQTHDAHNHQCSLHGKPTKSLNRIIQRYIATPLLLDGKKFDIRVYMLIANTVPFLVLYHKGYIRLSIHKYDNNCENLVAHLTNQFIQKKDPAYKEVKEETTWSMDRFNMYINENVAGDKSLEQDWVYNTLSNRMKQVMTYCFNAVKHKLHKKVGYFDLYGFDFMVDEDMKIWLIEVNVNPCLATNCEALRDIVPSVVKETINVAVECFEKSRKHRPLLPLKNSGQFDILHCDELARGGQLNSKPTNRTVKDAPSTTKTTERETVGSRARSAVCVRPPRSASLPSASKTSSSRQLLLLQSRSSVAIVPDDSTEKADTTRASTPARRKRESATKSPYSDNVLLRMSLKGKREKTGKDGRHSRGS